MKASLIMLSILTLICSKVLVELHQSLVWTVSYYDISQSCEQRGCSCNGL